MDYHTLGLPSVIAIFSPSLGLDGAAACSSVILEQQENTNISQSVTTLILTSSV